MNSELERFIGKHIDELSGIGDVLISEGNRHNIDLKSSKEFFGMKYNKLQLTTDKAKTIEELSIGLSGIIDKAFYNDMINRYGSPNSILIKDKLISESQSKNDGEINQSLKKRMFSLKEGKFEDKPLYVLWNKEGYQIRIMLYYENSLTGVTFRKPTDSF